MKIRKVILKQGQCPGDILTMTRAVADLKHTFPKWKIGVDTPCPEIWENNPHITSLEDLKKGKVEIFDIKYPEINESGWRGHHFTDAFRHDIEKKLKVKIKKTGIIPELHISDDEKRWTNQVVSEFDYHGPFWLLNAGSKPDNELKQYPKWKEFVKLFNNHFNGSVRLVQIGHASHNHPILDGAYNLIGKTDLRQLIRLGYWARGTVGPLSFQFVMSAALGQSHVCVAAGKEGVRWHMYPHGRYLYTNGTMACCAYDGCWLGGQAGKCKDQMPDGSPRCFNLIHPYQILDAVKMYYEGGAL